MNVLEDLSALVALGAAFVAALSAVYARWQAKAAERANTISLHESRMSVYNGVSRFRIHLVGHGTSLKEDEVWKFGEVVESSEFYYPRLVHTRLEAVFEESMRLLTMNEDWEHVRKTNQVKAATLVEPRQELSRQLRNSCREITNEMKAHLRVGEA